MKRIFLLSIVTWLFVSMTAACSNVDAPDAPDSSDQAASTRVAKIAAELPETDFVALLTRTDEVEICAREIKVSMDLSLGPGFYPNGYERLGCECARDGASYILEQTEGSTPALRNAAIQVALNLDVIPYIFNETRHPGGMDAFVAFLKNDALDALGFNDEDFMAVINQVSTVNARIEDDPFAMVAEVPSCQRAFEKTRILFPGVADEDLAKTTEVDMAIQRLRYDSGIDLNMIDEILHSDDPRAECEFYHESGASTQDVIDTCNALRKKADTRFANCSNAQYDIASRLVMSAVYLHTRKSTAQTGDDLYYIASRIGGLEWRASDVENVFKIMSPGQDGAPNKSFPQEAKEYLIEAAHAAAT